MYCNNHLWGHACTVKTLGSLQPYFGYLMQLLYLLCAWHVWSSRDASSLKQQLNIVVKLLTFVRVFLQKSYNISYTSAISMQPRSSSTQGQMCRIKENTKPHQMCWLIGLLQNISKSRSFSTTFQFQLWAFLQFMTYPLRTQQAWDNQNMFFKVC